MSDPSAWRHAPLTKLGKSSPVTLSFARTRQRRRYDDAACRERSCAELGRDPADIERSALVGPDADPEAYLAAGITHLILMCGHPFDLGPLQRLLDLANG